MRPSSERHIGSLWVAIVWLLVTVQNESAQECGPGSSFLSGKLLVATNTGRILSSSSKGELTTQLPPNPLLNQSFTSSEFGLAYDPIQNSIYHSKALTNELHSLHQNPSHQAHWLKHLPIDNPAGGKFEWMPCALALDTTTSSLYVADCIANIVTVVQDAGVGGGFVRRAVLLEGLADISGMTIDSKERLLFVADKYKIHRIDLDGSNYQVVLAEYQNVDDVLEQITGELPPAFKESFKFLFGKKTSIPGDRVRKALNIGDVALDLGNKRIFWINAKSRRIESLDYNGGGRKLHHREARVSKFEGEDAKASLTILGGALYWTDDLKKEILRMDLHEGKKSRAVLKTNQEEIRKVIGIECNKNQQLIQNPCAGGNGQCQHMCVQSRSSPKGYRCLCDIGYTVAQDGRSCRPTQDFLLYVEGSYLRAKGLDSSSLTIKPSTDLFYPTTFLTGTLYGVEADPRTKSIYWSGTYPSDKIHERSSNSISSKLIQPDLLSSSVGRFAYDSITKNLYYFTYYYADFFTLSVLNTNDPSYSKIILDKVTGLVSGIDVHPDRGYLFFSQDYGNTRAIISRVQMDGTELTVLVQLTTDIEALAVDRESDRLYWTESGGQTIYHTDLSGRDRRQVPVPEGFTIPTSMSFLGNWLYAVVSRNSKIVRLDKLTGSSALVLASRELPETLNPTLRLVSGSNQSSSPAESLCGLGRHDCAKFCFVVPESNTNGIDASARMRRQCGCPYGQALADDRRSCIDDRQRQPAFLPCKYNSFKCNKRTEGSSGK